MNNGLSKSSTKPTPKVANYNEPKSKKEIKTMPSLAQELKRYNDSRPHREQLIGYEPKTHYKLTHTAHKPTHFKKKINHAS